MKRANKNKTRTQVIVINGKNVLVEAMWEKSNQSKEWVFMGMRTIEVLN